LAAIVTALSAYFTALDIGQKSPVEDVVLGVARLWT
jgi:hypothetical protein